MENNLILENQVVIMKALIEILTSGRDVYSREKELKKQMDRTVDILETKKSLQRISIETFDKLKQHLEDK